MNESILNSIKKLLGLDPNYDAFDQILIAFINSALMNLSQIGVGAIDFSITGVNELWSDYLLNRDDLAASTDYVYISTRLIFDPPSSASVIASFEKIRDELAWRLKVRSERLD